MGQRERVTSPGGDLELTLANDGEGRLTYSVTRCGEPVVESSPLGLQSTTHDLTAGVTMTRSSGRGIDESYTMRTGKRRERQVIGSEITVPLRDANRARAELIMRAHEDGIAFRYRLLGEGKSKVILESTGFAIPSGARALLRPYDGGDDGFVFTAGAYEKAAEILPLGTPTDAIGFAFPALFELERGAGHVLITESDLRPSYCGSRLHEVPQGGLYTLRFPDEREGNGVGAVLPEAALPFATPWRVIAAGDLATIVESTLVDDLSTASVVDELGWVRPGRVAWSWFSQGTGTPELQSEYIAFAGEYGWDYVLIDAGWDRWDEPARAVPELVAEAEAVGVKLFLWYNSGGEHSPFPGETPTDRMLDPEVRRAEMRKISDWGIAGIKVDFFNSDKQDRIAQYISILEDAKDHQLLVNVHGATVPRGWQRTHPHLMTHEAINGAEYYKSGVDVLGDRAPSALMNVHAALLRNVVGSMDYTPVVFEAALTEKQLPYAHSLALSVVFESGLQHFADRADSNPELGYRALFGEYPYVGDFLSAVPVAWDDTRLIGGNVDRYVILARRSGPDWHLAGIHAADAPAEYRFVLDFLDEGTTYDLTLIEQGETPRSLKRRHLAVRTGHLLAIELAPNGGFAATLTPQ